MAINLAKVQAGAPVKKAAQRKKKQVEVNGRRKPTIRIDRELFCKQLIKNSMNATAAYKAVSRKVTDGTAATEGYRLLREPETIEILQPMLKRLFADAGIEADYVFRRWLEMSQASPLDYFEITKDGKLGSLKLDDLTPAQRLNLKEITVTPTPHGNRIAIKVYDAQKAVNMIARHLGLLVDRLPEKDVERIGDLLERGIKRIKQTKDLDGWKDMVLDVDYSEVS